MFWTILLVITCAFAAGILGHHAFQLWQLWENIKLKSDKNLTQYMDNCIQFSDHFYKFSPKTTRFCEELKDSYQSEAFKNFLMNKDLGPHALDQLPILNKYFEAQLEKKKKVYEKFAANLPLVGWSWVLAAISFYFSGYSLSDSSFVLSSQFIGLAVLGVAYGLAIHIFIVQPNYEKTSVELEVLKEKQEIMRLTLHNLLAGRSRHEIEKSLKLFTDKQKQSFALRVA